MALLLLFWVGGRDMASPPAALTDTHDIRAFDQWDGLRHPAVSGLASTPDGLLWMATFSDLVVYDGIGFSRATLMPRSQGRLAIRTLACDAGGRLWLGANASVGVSEGKSCRILGPEDGVPQAIVRHLVVRGAGDAWGSWEGGVLRIRGDRCEGLEPPPGTGSEACPLVADEGDRLWCANRKGLWFRDGEAWRRQEGPDGVVGQELCGLGTARGGGVWVAWDGEAWRFREGRWQDRRARPEGMRGDAVTVLEDRQGGLWIGGWGTGLALLGPGGEVGVATAGNGLPANSVTSLVEDTAGNVWVGLNGAGLVRVRRWSFRVFGVESGLRAMVNSVAEEEPGVLLVGTHGGGLMRWEGGVFAPYPGVGKELGEGALVSAVLKDRRGEVWAGTLERGLMRLQDGRWEAVSAAETGAQVIRTLHEDGRGRLWVGTAAGVAVREGGRFRVLGEADGIPHMVVHGMAEDAEGRMWVCGMGYGLFRMGKERFERVGVPGLPERHRFACLAAGRDGSMWVGVLGNGEVPGGGVLGDGLVRVKDGKARVYGRDLGLFGGESVGVVEDGAGEVWAWTPDRCQRVPVASFDAVDMGKASRLDVRMFDRRDGFPGMTRVGFHPVVTRGGDGRLWWATAKGLALVDVGRLPARMVAPGVAWRWVRDGAGNRDGLGAPGGVMALGEAKGELEVGFRADRMAAAEHVRFEARLLPNEAWQGVLNVHRLSMQDLRPGAYRLEVRASEREGEWGKPSAVTFEVPRPMWQRGWFMALVVVGAAAAAAGVGRWATKRRMRRRMRELERETMLERERMRISRDLHDDVGASVTRVTLLLERACRAGAIPAEVLKPMQEGLREARGTKGSLDAAVWAVDPVNDTWSELVSYLGQFFVEYCHDAGLRPVVDLPEPGQGDGEQALGAEWRHHVVLIVKEALNNAVKHSGGTEVRLRIADAGEGMELEVGDNGKGWAGGKPGHEGNGLGNMALRARSLGGRLEVDGEPGKGTRVRAFIPWTRRAASGER